MTNRRLHLVAPLPAVALMPLALVAGVVGVGMATSQRVLTISRETTARERAVWDLWADVPRRTRWDDSLEWARIDGRFVRGARGQLKLKEQPPRRFEIIECDEPTHYTDRFFLPMGAKMDWHHSVVELDTGGRQITFRIEVSGPTAVILAPVLRRILARQLPPTVDRLGALA